VSESTGATAPIAKVPLRVIAREWGRIGVVGVGGPPAHIALLRRLSVERRGWLSAEEFEHAVAAANLLPGPASTQLMIYCAWRLRGTRGAVIGGLCFILPGFVLIVGLSALFFAHHPARVILAAALGAGAVVPAIAARTAWQLAVPSWRATSQRAVHVRWTLYLVVGVVAALFAPALVVLALVACGAIEVIARRTASRHGLLAAAGVVHGVVIGGVGALAWVAFKVGALSYGGGFVIIPLMQHDVVSTYHWMSGPQFLNAVALGQVTPGPVVLTVAAVGYAAHGLSGAALAAAVAFAPSFAFILLGARYFERIRTNPSVLAFLLGAGPSVIGAIGASAWALAMLITHLWQGALLAGALIWVFALRRGSTSMLLGAALVGIIISGVVPVST
jgi:chromate transporter